MRKKNLFHTTHSKGFGLVGLMIGGLILTIMMMGLVKVARSSFLAQRTVRQISDFDTVKTTVKAVLADEMRCRSAFKNAAGTALIQMNPAPPPVAPNPPIFARVQKVYLGGGAGAPIATLGETVGSGIWISEMGFEKVSNGPTVTKDVGSGLGPIPLNSYTVRFKMSAESRDGVHQELDPEPTLSILTNPITNEILGCDLTSGGGGGGTPQTPQQNCANLGGTWNAGTNTCSFSRTTACAAGQFSTGLNATGDVTCAAPSVVYQ